MSLYVALPVGRTPAACLHTHVRASSTAVAASERNEKMPQEQCTLQALNLHLA